jgi:hypothetical protein
MLTAHERLAIRRMREKGHSRPSCTVILMLARYLRFEISDVSETFMKNSDEINEYLKESGER